MMNVQEMRRIVDRVTNDEMPSFVEAVVQNWSADIDTLAYFRSSANHIFRFQAAGKPFYLRLSSKTERLLQSLQYELGLVLYLAGQGLPVAKPVPTKTGNLIEVLDAGYYAVAFEGLPGKQWMEPDDLNPDLSYLWGKTLAQIHTFSQSYSAPTPYDRSHWLHQLHTAQTFLSADETAIQKTLQDGIAWLNTLPINTENYGLIHGDLELDNLIWDGKTLGVIDFDGTCYNWYAADIALALDDMWDDNPVIVEDFLKGYTSVYPIAHNLTEFIPRFRRVYDAWQFAHMQRVYRDIDIQGQPEWLVKMYRRHENWFETKRQKLQQTFKW